MTRYWLRPKTFGYGQCAGDPAGLAGDACLWGHRRRNDAGAHVGGLVPDDRLWGDGLWLIKSKTDGEWRRGPDQ